MDSTESNLGSLRRKLSTFAVAIGVMTAVLIPAFFFAISFEHRTQSLQRFADGTADAVSAIVFERPLLWSYLGDRLTDALEFQLRSVGAPSSSHIIDRDGNLIVELNGRPGMATIKTTSAIGDENNPVAQLSIELDISSLWIGTALSAGVGLLIGAAIFLVIKTYPMRALVEAYAERERIDQEVRRLNRDLEIRVAARTRELRNEIEVHRRTMARLRLAKNEAEAASNAKSEFLSLVSHELRTPLNAILGFGQVMETETKVPLPDNHRESLGYIMSAGAHLTNLIVDLLELSKIEDKRTSFSMERVDPVATLRECLDMVEIDAAQRSIIVAMRSDSDRMVWIDRSRLVQILVNLLSNAIKYNKEGCSIDTVCENSPGSGGVRICITDCGPGIPPGMLDDLYQPFNRLWASDTEIEGTGLGLALCKQLVEAMGGLIGCESEIGKGSPFWVEFPAVAG